ncbi:MAG: hypothetical protein IPM29_11920 [Planctomycetes bacterium]|nr:hypothetical protein [Planctomycetota bacterium]
MVRSLVALCLLLPLLHAQQTITVGGTTTAPSRANAGKGNVFSITQSVVLADYEMYLNVPGPETLTFFIHRSPTRNGSAAAWFSKSVTVDGTGVGPAWYSSGPIGVPLVNGNTYVLGVSWAGTVTYHYVIATAGSPIAIGTWERAVTTTNPPPSLVTITGNDSAQYYQRLTVIPNAGAASDVGTPCSGSGGRPPRLVASDFARIGQNFAVELVEATANTPALFVFGIGIPATTPFPLLGCSYWLVGVAPAYGIPTTTSASGFAQLPLAIPADPQLVGLPLASQAAVLGAVPDLTNALAMLVVR